MVTIAIALLIVLAVAVVAYPFFNPPPAANRAFAPQTDSTWEELTRQREAAYTAIKDLESEYALGKLSESDYRALRGKYEARAVRILQELDRLTASREPRAAQADDAIEREVLRLRGKRCPACGKRAAAGDKFCSKCGKPL